MAFATAFLVTLSITALLVFVKAHNTVIDWDYGRQDYSIYSKQTFKSGDSITFKYEFHRVDVVTKSEYKNCFSENPIQSFNDGNTTFTLKPGKMYFICGMAGHCRGDKGMHLQINVSSACRHGARASCRTVFGVLFVFAVWFTLTC
ncbi:hypothetical protein vseg_004759 [Gypsophila vaccaria]